MSILGITSMVVMALYSIFSWQVEGGDIPYSKMFGTFALLFEAAVRTIHFIIYRNSKRLTYNYHCLIELGVFKSLGGNASLWHMHESHHKPREGPFELNDVFAITNAVPAIPLISYGVFHKGLFPGLCFGAVINLSSPKSSCRSMSLPPSPSKSSGSMSSPTVFRRNRHHRYLSTTNGIVCCNSTDDLRFWNQDQAINISDSVCVYTQNEFVYVFCI